MSALPFTFPNWTRSIRFRLTLLYSSVLFGLAALLVGALYLGLSVSLRDEPVTRQEQTLFVPGRGFTRQEVINARELERRINERTLDNLRNFSLGALPVLFLASLAVGWVIAGRVLAPIARISSVARDIQATNLSRRIELQGPDDELKELADTFDAMLARIDAAFAAQRQFVADASHELRNPLAIIQTNVDVALADPEASPEALRRTAQVVRRATERMARLVDDLLALARMEARSARREAVDLGQVLRDAQDEFAAAARGRDLMLEHAAPERLSVTGDRESLKRAVANLLENSVRLAPAGSTVRLAAGSESGWAWIAVADEGPGIALDHQSRIFQRFYRADRGRSRSEGGSGLGLAIVKEIAVAHGGQVRVTSRLGEGAVFLIWLPLPGSTGSPPESEPASLGRQPATPVAAGASRRTAFSRARGRRL